MRRQGTVDKKKTYFNKQKGVMTKNDHDVAETYGQRAKQKYLKKQKNK